MTTLKLPFMQQIYLNHLVVNVYIIVLFGIVFEGVQNNIQYIASHFFMIKLSQKGLHTHIPRLIYR